MYFCKKKQRNIGITNTFYFFYSVFQSVLFEIFALRIIWDLNDLNICGDVNNSNLFEVNNK